MHTKLCWEGAVWAFDCCSCCPIHTPSSRGVLQSACASLLNSVFRHITWNWPGQDIYMVRTGSSGKESACRCRISWLNPKVMKMLLQSLGQQDNLKKEMETYCSIPAWKIPQTEEPGGLQPMEVTESLTWLGTHKSYNTRVAFLLLLFNQRANYWTFIRCHCFLHPSLISRPVGPPSIKILQLLVCDFQEAERSLNKPFTYSSNQ